MKIGFAGAGAVGCHYGSLLQQAGNKVSLLGRGAHLAAMQEVGLRHVSGGVERNISVTADDQPAVLGDSDVIIFSCKMNDLQTVTEATQPFIGSQTLFVTLENGVEAPEIVARAFPGHAIVAGTAFIGARIDSPGTVIHSAAGGIRLGLWQTGSGEQRLAGFVQAVSGSGIPVRDEPDVKEMLWRKLLWNCGFNALTAITRRFARDMAAGKETLPVIRAAMLEAVIEARAAGVNIGDGDILKHIRITLKMGPVKTSMWQDLDRGRQTEVDFINGLVVRRAQKRGLDAPVNRMLVALVHAIEKPWPGSDSDREMIGI